jgi:hypothetical protein
MARGVLWATLTNPQALLEAVSPRFAEVEAHHLTLRFGVDLEPYRHVIGKQFEGRVICEAWDDAIQAVQVELPADIAELCENEHPHVTVSHREGIPAKRSNPLLANPPHSRPVALTLGFKVETEPW